MHPERWSTHHDGRLHEVFVRRRLLDVVVEWHVDSELVARTDDSDSTIVLTPDEDQDPGLGAVGVKAPTWLKATRRVVLRPPSAATEEAARLDPQTDREDEEDEPYALLLSFDGGTQTSSPTRAPAARVGRGGSSVTRSSSCGASS